ncbi:MAG: hypothetical protein ACKOJF_29330, partial [Planctomycetaceae bacterium]
MLARWVCTFLLSPSVAMPLRSEVARRVATAAALRCSGQSWEQVAARFGCQLDTCRRWPQRYPELWRKAMRWARKERITEADAEAIAVLRGLLRSESEAIRRDAARAILGRRRSKSGSKSYNHPDSFAHV